MGGFPQTCKKEFRTEHFGLNYNQPSDFIHCQWQRDRKASVSYLVYRCVVAVYFSGTLIMCVCNVGRTDEQGVFFSKWPIYLTNWGYTLYTVQAFLGIALLMGSLLEERKNGEKFPKETEINWCYQLYWVLHTIAVVIAFAITGSFWVAIYDPAHHEMDLLSVVSHVLNSVVMGIDFLLVKHPIRLLHSYWPVGFLTVYFAFSVVYFCVGGTDHRGQPKLYSILDWNHPIKTCIVCSIALVYVLSVHITTWLMYLLRGCMFNTWIKNQLPVHAEAVLLNK